MTWFLAKLGIRILVFAAVFGVVAHRDDRIEVKPRWALPLVGLVFALLNAALYWLLAGVVKLATFWFLWFLAPIVAPFAVNLALLWGTQRVLRPLKIQGLWPMLRLAAVLTLAHGLLWLVLDKIVG